MARADAGLTISELARRAGVTRDTISNAEKGRHGLQASTLNKLARALGKVPSELLAEEERLAPKATSSALEPPLFYGLGNEPRREYVHISELLRRIGAAGGAALEVAHEWRSEAARNLSEGVPLPKYRTQEMLSFHNELSRLYVRSIESVLEGAQEGITGVVRDDGTEQVIAADPSLWPRELRAYVYEAGARIAVLPKLVEQIELEGAGTTEQKLYEAFKVESHLPAEVLREEEWRGELDKALAQAGGPIR